MKKMTCAQMGGPCDAEMTASTSDEMLQKGMEHLNTAHPEMAEKVKNNTPEENAAWGTKFNADWAALPEIAA